MWLRQERWLPIAARLTWLVEAQSGKRTTAVLTTSRILCMRTDNAGNDVEESMSAEMIPKLHGEKDAPAQLAADASLREISTAAGACPSFSTSDAMVR